MTGTAAVPVPSAADDALLDDVTALVRRWVSAADAVPVDAAAARLAGVLRDPAGLDFTVAFVDGVVRPEDLRAAARTLARIAPDVPRFLPLPLRLAVRLGGALAPAAPAVVVPAARLALRAMVGHLILDARPARLGRGIARIRGRGARLNVNLLGEAVLGREEAGRRLAGVRALMERSDVDYVSIKVSAATAPHSPWAFEEAVADIVAELAPLYAVAQANGTFLNLDMEEYKDLDLTIAVFTRILDEERFLVLRAGIVLQAYLPDALSAMQRLHEWAAGRRARGGEAIKVRLVKGANLPMERVEASLHDWPLATWATKLDSDTNYKRVLRWSLDPRRTDAVRIGVAGHNLFDVAYAWLLAGERGVRDAVEFEMLLGMATGQADAVGRDVGGLLLYTPVVHPAEFDVAIAYLIRRLEESASSENFMSAVFALSADEALFARERDRFAASLAALDDDVPAPHRLPRDTAPAHQPSAAERAADRGRGRFANAVDTDPAVAAHRGWARSALAAAPGSGLGAATLAAGTVDDAARLRTVLEATAAAGVRWAQTSGADRAAILHRVADALEAARGDLVTVMASEAGKTVDQADPEVSEAIDFARHSASRIGDLDRVTGARFVPARLTVVAPPWNFPVAIPAGGVLSALAAGSAVVLKPAGPASRCGALLAEILWAAGVPRDVLALVQVDEERLGRALIADPAVDRVVLTGAYETAALFRSFRADLPLIAETSGKNALVVTPSADLDLAVKDLVQSAFGHAGQKCSAASLAILVGSVAGSRRFRTQLADAVSSLHVGPAADPATRMGPLVEPASGKLLDALTTLAPGERWLVEPRRLDAEGRLWSPGVKEGVAPGSDFHRTEVFGPVLGIMMAATLDDALALQNAVDYGLTAGLHSLDAAEIAHWVEHVEAGNLYVNRGTTGAIVARQPFGGWKRSAVGPGAKAGGPNHMHVLGTWEPTEQPVPAVAPSDAPWQRAVLAWAVTADERDMLAASLASDEAAWDDEFGTPRELAGLLAERNVLRYRPTSITVRVEPGAAEVELVRVVAAGLRAGAVVRVSTTAAPTARTAALLREVGVGTAVESLEALRDGFGRTGGRVRRVGGDAAPLRAAFATRPDVAVHDGPVTTAGRIELLPFLREQSISVTAHRFGTPTSLFDPVRDVDSAPAPGRTAPIAG